MVGLKAPDVGVWGGAIYVLPAIIKIITNSMKSVRTDTIQRSNYHGLSRLKSMSISY